jgi:hypothetical protein
MDECRLRRALLSGPSAWLVTELGPWLNVTSGIADYPWRRFILWDIMGEVLWVVLHVTLGYVFSDRVAAIADILGNLGWVMIGIILATILGWKIVQYLRIQDSSSSEQTTTLATDIRARTPSTSGGFDSSSTPFLRIR